MRRLIGLLMIFVILFPLIVGAAGVVVARDIVGQVQVKWTERLDVIQAKMDKVETTINTVSERFQALQTVANRIATAADAAAQTVIKTLTNFKIRYGGFQWPSAIQDALGFLHINLPNIPAVNLTVPGLSAVRDFLQNIYNTFASLAKAIADITLIAQVPGQIGEVVTEVQGLTTDITQIVGPYGRVLLILGIGVLVWMAAIYLVLVYTWLVRGWAMLLGRPIPA